MSTEPGDQAVGRYDEPLFVVDLDALPRYVAVDGQHRAGLVTCSLCAAVVAGQDGQRQHTEYHRLLGLGLLRLSGHPR